jgi:hypothetical protein
MRGCARNVPCLTRGWRIKTRLERDQHSGSRTVEHSFFVGVFSIAAQDEHSDLAVRAMRNLLESMFFE